MSMYSAATPINPFFSSPTQQSQLHNASSRLFFTPQANSKTSGTGWAGNNNVGTFPYSPQTPSPLRTSKNAGNVVMSSPTSTKLTEYGTENWESENVSDEENGHVGAAFGKENMLPENISNVKTSDTTFSFNHHHQIQPDPQQQSSTNTNAFFLDSSSTPSNPFQFQFQQPTTRQTNATKFQYQTRATRTSSPSTLLQTQTSSNRDARKRLFLDRIRQKRDDDRSDRSGEQILRMDWLRERREWEERMTRLGNSLVGGGSSNFDEGQEQQLQQEEEELLFDQDGNRWHGGYDAEQGTEMELSPTEEKEIEELVNGYYFPDVTSTIPKDDEFDFEDDEYEEVFTEVLSQEQQSQSQHQDQPQVWEQDQIQQQQQQQYQSNSDPAGSKPDFSPNVDTDMGTDMDLS